MPKLEAELEQIKIENEQLAVTLDHYRVELNNTKRKICQENWKSVALVREFGRVTKEQKRIRTEKEMLQSITNKLLINALRRTHKISELMDD